jgi:hypothetical protein
MLHDNYQCAGARVGDDRILPKLALYDWCEFSKLGLRARWVGVKLAEWHFAWAGPPLGLGKLG